VSSVFQLSFLLGEQAEIQFVYERGRLQYTGVSLAPEVDPSDFSKMRIHQRHKALKRRLVAFFPLRE
jgi:hypothetical protein